MYLDFCLGCAKAQTENFERVRHALSDHGAKGRIVEPLFWVIIGLCGVGLLLLRDSIRDTANKRSLELCTTIVHVFLGGWSM